ncbi:MAG TPA: TolC family protein [Novimethylophilus sp.]|uniref:TolC family protein n=1 Tax=Novimethylophilus sp. TaxID=2137426 RepID=UPI002F418561
MALSLLILPVIAAGEELERLEIDSQLTLAHAVKQAFARSPQQQVLKAGKISIEAKSVQADSLLPGAPAVSMRHQNDAIGSGRNLREWEATLELPVWMPGQRAARRMVAREAMDGLGASQGGLMFGLAGQVRDAIWDVAMNTNAVGLAEQRVKNAEALQRDVSRRWLAGELARTDAMLAQNETLQAQTAQLQAQAELKHAEHRYWMLTGLKALPAKAEEPLSTQAGIDDSHPLLSEVAAKVALAQGERELVRVEKRENPQVLINARHERGAFDADYNSSVGLAVRIPLDAQVRSAPLLAGAEMGLAQAMSERDQRMLTLQAALHEAEHNLEVTRASVQLVEEQNRLAQENLRLAKKAFDLGESDLVSLLRVQATAQDAERALRSSRIQVQWNIARFNQAMGVLP